MSRKKRLSKTNIFIACEGTQTEYWYFKAIKEILDEADDFALTIYPDKNDKEESSRKHVKTDTIHTDHNSLCKKAIEKLSNNFCDEAWLVFDKDGHAGIENTFQEAQKQGINIAFSSISFEHWVLLHFEKNATSFVKSDCKDSKKHYLYCGTNQHEADCQGTRCVAGHIRLKKYIANYDKSGGNLYTQIGKRQSVAFENAAWLRWRQQDEIQKTGGKIYTINPYSDVDILLKRLFKIEEHIIWGNLNETASFSLFSLKVTGDAFKIHLTIKNNGKSSEKLTTHNFFLTDENLTQSPLNMEKFVLISSLETVSFTLILPVELSKMGFFNFQFDNYRLIMALYTEG
jgi:RloB-like protein